MENANKTELSYGHLDQLTFVIKFIHLDVIDFEWSTHAKFKDPPKFSNR